ncbi:hypothetical protein BSLG_002867 [Batrachochytrium salamandrivorans]|nr:hypothetical protein BSLG_002867 [Batrachochytrium salamandrivorans]
MLYPLPLPRSVTHCLAENAVHVRDAAKWIGRAIVKLKRPQSAMIVARAADPAFALFTRHLALYLIETPREFTSLPGLSVFVEASLKDSPVFGYQQLIATKPHIKDKLNFWTPSLCATNADAIDFIVTLGGDGTVLYAAWLFQQAQVPPIVPFHLGSLGFLTVFDIGEIRDILDRVIGCYGDGVRVNMRMRLNCVVHRHVKPASSQPPSMDTSPSTKDPTDILGGSHHPIRDPPGPISNPTFDTIADMDDLEHTMSPLDKLSQSLTRTSLSDLIESKAIPVRPDSDISEFSPSFMKSRPRLSQRPGVADHLIAPGSAHHADRHTPTPTFSTDSYNAAETSKGSFQSSPYLSGGTQGLERRPSSSVPTETFQILNDLVVDRGPSAYMSQMELFVDDKHLTTVQADGLVLSTPTGSTAYSLSAGGSLVHPEVPSFLITPICAHSLSFRPMLLPDSVELKVQVPLDSRNTAWASSMGDIESSSNKSSDWFESLRKCLHWNERTRQRPLDVHAVASVARSGVCDVLGSPSLDSLATCLFGGSVAESSSSERHTDTP